MKIVTLPVRTAFVEKLDAIDFMDKTVYAFEEYLQETAVKKRAIINIAGIEVEAYIILLNQTSNEDSSKCIRNDQTTIQVQVTTVFPSGKGGSKYAEQLADLALGRLFKASGQFGDLSLDEPLNLWKLTLEGSKNINYDTETSRVWITQLMISGSVSQT